MNDFLLTTSPVDFVLIVGRRDKIKQSQGKKKGKHFCRHGWSWEKSSRATGSLLKRKPGGLVCSEQKNAPSWGTQKISSTCLLSGPTQVRFGSHAPQANMQRPDFTTEVWTFIPPTMHRTGCFVAGIKISEWSLYGRRRG